MADGNPVNTKDRGHDPRSYATRFGSVNGNRKGTPKSIHRIIAENAELSLRQRNAALRASARISGELEQHTETQDIHAAADRIIEITNSVAQHAQAAEMRAFGQPIQIVDLSAPVDGSQRSDRQLALHMLALLGRAAHQADTEGDIIDVTPETPEEIK